MKQRSKLITYGIMGILFSIGIVITVTPLEKMTYVFLGINYLILGNILRKRLKEQL